ncbi:Toll/interleukin-1 receptor domain-containing protein [Tanacetum coccineum]
MESSSSRSWNYDVFLSFRGEDTRKTFVDHLYAALVKRPIRPYKDDIELPQGEYIGPALLKAIEESHIAVIVFSKNYADSSWCLDELAYIMKCKDERGTIVMPVFYDVEPWEVRKQKGNFRKAFVNHEAKNTSKVESWRKALVDASNLAGWEPKNITNGHQSAVVQEIVDKICATLFPYSSKVNEDLVGMGACLQDLKSRLDIGSDNVQMVGIWGVGGGGKTTLATSVYMELRHHFKRHCFVENIREESSKCGLKRLQENILSAVFKTKWEVENVAEGIQKIRMLSRSKVLLLLDDVDKLDQLEALAGSHIWFGPGSRIIITTRDEHLLRTHKVNQIYHVRLLSNEESIRLFNKHAYNEKSPIKDYEKLSLGVVTYAAGLPLALKVLGSFLYDRDEKEWMSTLVRLKDIPDTKILEQLKISYDGLKSVEKELFLDIACFFRGESKDSAMEMLDACGFHHVIGITVLRQKYLITINSYGKFDMHDLVQEMGHYIVRGENPNNPENHSRVWKYEEINSMCLGDETMENDKIEAIRYIDDGHSSGFCNIVSNMKKLRFLSVTMPFNEFLEGPKFLSNELQYIHWEWYPASPFPDRFQPLKLVVLKIHCSLLKELWKGYKLGTGNEYWCSLTNCIQ